MIKKNLGNIFLKIVHVELPDIFFPPPTVCHGPEFFPDQGSTGDRVEFEFGEVWIRCLDEYIGQVEQSHP